jgi:LysM repeat protein
MVKKQEKSAPNAVVCATCGSKNAEGSTRCAVCGASLKPTPSGGKTRRAASEVTLSLPAALGILAIFVILAVGLTYLATRGLGLGTPEEPEATVTLTPTETVTASPTPTETIVPSPTPLPTLEYFVVENDSLLAIAVRYDVSIQSILQLNPGLNNQSILSVGQRLYLPQATPTPSPEPTATLPPEEATRAACDTIIYTVEANDTLGAIADNYNVNLRAIMDFNGMTSETVFLGQVLIIPLCERNPTPGPSPTPTPPPPYPAANLLLPQDGAAFTLADDSVTLQWAAVGELRENEFYQVTVEDVTEGTGTRKLVDYVKDTKYIIPNTFRPNESLPHILRWWIQVVRQTGVTGEGEAIYVTGGAISLKRDFTWSGAAPGATATP